MLYWRYKRWKKKKLKENIQYLEELFNTLQESINNLKIFFEKINKDKEELKKKIQIIFTKIRNELNSREDALLLEVDQQFENNFFKEEIIKESEKLPNKIKLSIEKSKLIDKESNDNNLNYVIYNCINIENNIKEVNIIEENLKKYNNPNNLKIEFSPKEEDINKFLEEIKSFGNIGKANLFESSSIINNTNYQELINNWIKEKVNKIPIKFELIFKMSENGSKSEDFHKYCDNKGPTLILIKTIKNRIFGGFTPLSWDDKTGDKFDKLNQTFLFSCDMRKRYDIINNNKKAIQCSRSYGPYFGDYDFGFQQNLKEGTTYANYNCNFLSNNNLDLTGGKGDSENFITEELEVYKVIY